MQPKVKREAADDSVAALSRARHPLARPRGLVSDVLGARASPAEGDAGDRGGMLQWASDSLFGRGSKSLGHHSGPLTGAGSTSPEPLLPSIRRTSSAGRNIGSAAAAADLAVYQAGVGGGGAKDDIALSTHTNGSLRHREVAEVFRSPPQPLSPILSRGAPNLGDRPLILEQIRSSPAAAPLVVKKAVPALSPEGHPGASLAKKSHRATACTAPPPPYFSH